VCKNTKYKLNIIQTCRPKYHILLGNILGADSFTVTSSRLPNMSQQQAPATPTSSQQNARRLADYYRPRYSKNAAPQQSIKMASPISGPLQGLITAHAVEVNGLPDDLDDLDFNSMAIGEDIVSDPAIFDTGASHGFTGSKALLHNFQFLKNPILVSVATSGGNSFISG
jgi:hypothetical protein